jgi:hypothetical protein
MYTDNTPLPFGKYKYVSLCRVPPDYLLNIYQDKTIRKELLEYIENNMERIIMRKEGIIETPSLELVCDKISYYNEKLAKQVLNRIHKYEHDYKVPVRAYECPKCSQWHLTSMPLEEYKNITFKL